jgi:probable F420-dependent oxidoreductase
MQVGVWMPVYRRWVDGGAIRQLAVAAEEMGFGSIWVQDHLVAPTGGRDEQPVEPLSSWLAPDDYGNEQFSAIEYYGESNWWLDPYVLWGFLAACTWRCELASDVIVIPYRDPIVQAKMLGTLDVLSGGRMVFGVGVGHVPGEFEALGVDYSRRGKLTDEYLQVMDALLQGRETSFDGPTIKFGNVLPLIEPVNGRRPPFLIGGVSKAAIRRAARLGDGWLPAHLAPENLKPGLEYLAECAAEAGRPVPAVSVAVVWGLTDPGTEQPAGRRVLRSREQITDLIGQYAELGVERLAVDVPNPNLAVTMRQLELLAEAAAAAGALASPDTSGADASAQAGSAGGAGWRHGPGRPHRQVAL